MESNNASVEPLENIVKKSIEDLIQPYTEVKSAFFKYAKKEDKGGIASEHYSLLIDILLRLVELVKPDNPDALLELIGLQEKLEHLDNLTEEISDDIIDDLRLVCGVLDTTFLRYHLKTQPTIARCISHTPLPLLNITYNGE